MGSKERNHKSEANPNPLNGKLDYVKVVPGNNGLSVYHLGLDNGTVISLPPIAEFTVKRLRVGDVFEFSPREDIIEGELKRFDDQTSVVVNSTDDSPLRFIIGNDSYVSPHESPNSKVKI